MKKRDMIILSIIYTLFSIIGTSFIFKHNFSLIYKLPILTIILTILLYIIFYYALKYLTKYLETKRKNNIKKNKILTLFDNHPIIFSMIVILILWLPYIIAYYPAILNPDSSFQIKQYLGIDNKYSYYVNLIDKNQIITNHHPVIHTLLLGFLVKLGINIHNTNLGFFLYSLIQIILLSFTLSLTISYSKFNKVDIKKRIYMLLIYSLVPVFPFYSMTAVKDVIYTCFIIIYTILVHYSIKNELNIKKTIILLLVSIFLFLFRNNGIYIFILTTPLLLIKNKNFKKILIVILLVISSYISYNKIILPYFKITPTSIRESLSIPFQQTARFIRDHEKDLSKQDKENISKILNYEIIKKEYKPSLSDPVKNTFNKDATKEDINNYFKTWYKGLLKHPITYIEATVENTYGYIYPIKTNWYFYHKFQKYLIEDKIDYHYIKALKPLRTKLKSYAFIFPYIPIIGLLVNIGFNNWLLLYFIFYFISNKKYKNIVWLMPSIISFLVCFASPANTYFRYALPIIFAMPLLLVLFHKEINKH